MSAGSIFFFLAKNTHLLVQYAAEGAVHILREAYSAGVRRAVVTSSLVTYPNSAMSGPYGQNGKLDVDNLVFPEFTCRQILARSRKRKQEPRARRLRRTSIRRLMPNAPSWLSPRTIPTSSSSCVRSTFVDHFRFLTLYPSWSLLALWTVCSAVHTNPPNS